MEENIKKAFGACVREFRTDTGLSQEKFALKINMDRTYFASVESGRRNISIENIKKIARGLSVQVIDTFGGCGITEKFETEGGEGRYLRDGLHPKENGQEREGRFAAAMIKSKMY